MKKQGWPAFPYSDWTSIEKWSMSSLREIASHLKGKTAAPRERSSSGFRGNATDMEKQIFQHISDLEQQVFELEDALQAALQIIDDNRPSQRARRGFHWISDWTRRCKERVERNLAYWILGLFSVLVTLYAVAKYFFHFFGR